MYTNLKKIVFIITLLTGCTFINQPTREEVIELLETNGNCELPCFWGMTPGETKWNDARLWLSELTKIYDEYSFYNNDDGGYSSYSIPFTIDKEETPVRQFVIIPTIDEEKIQRIVVLINNSLTGSDYISRYWQRYSIREILRDMGKPDKIFFNICPKYSHPCFEILLVYEGEKTVIHLLGGSLPKNKICPQIGEGGDITSISLSFANPSSNLDIVPPSNFISYTTSDYWKPIHDVLRISEHKFYEKVLSEGPACFDVINKE